MGGSVKNVQESLDQLCINTIRTLAMDGVQKANSGHPGLPMGAAAMAYALWTRALRHNPAHPSWPNRDRFILSPGHGCMLLYCLLHLTGYDLSLDELKRFRQWGSRTPGHSEGGMTPGVETTTGPLGQGFGNGVGMAIAERFLAHHFNRPGYPIVDHYVYAIVSDGDLMEGISSEAASLAGHLGLGKLIYLYDDNRITIDGSTDMAFTENVGQRFEAYGWHVQRVDGNDLKEVEAALDAAQAASDRPSIIIARTHIAYGSPNKQDTAEAHVAPLGEEEIKLTKRALGWPLEPAFYISDEALSHFREALQQGRAWEAQWQAQFDAYAAAHPELAAEWRTVMDGRLPESWADKLPVFTPGGGGMATREASGKVLNAIAPHLPTLIGGSADLTPSNNTYLKGYGDFQRDNVGARNFHFGVREHAMGSILNGMALHGGVIPYGGTFLIFSDYMRPAIRLAALSHIHVIYVFTHDSIGLGEDGPTHEPIEHLASLRAMPNLTVLRPADANEIVEAWRVIMNKHHEAVALILTRQDVPTLDRSKYAPASGLAQGAYILADTSDGRPDVILIGTGSEVSLCVAAYEQLKSNGIKTRVVSMPSWELFEQQDQSYRDHVLPPAVTARVAVEQASTFGWAHYVGTSGTIIGMTTFGASAPLKVLQKEFGFTKERIVEAAKQQVKQVR